MPITVAVDAMGGDNAPGAIVRGALEAARALPDLELILVGDEAKIREAASGRSHGVGGTSLSPNVRLVHCSECIGMDEPPSHVFRRKKNCSLAIAARLVAEGEAQAFFSAGNTGASMAAAKYHLHTIEGIDRPALATILPTARGNTIDRMLLLDAGANVDCSESNLLEFALMGSAYASRVMGKPDPAVALVNIGGEAGKGNALTKSVASILKLMPIRFIGNIEGTEIYTGKADVIVCDGFVGNVILKTSEGTAEFLMGSIAQEARRSPFSVFGGLLMKPAFRRVKRIADYAEVGGAPLLGVRGGCVIGHGRSNERAVLSGIGQAARCVSQNPIPEIERLLELTRTMTFLPD